MGESDFLVLKNDCKRFISSSSPISTTQGAVDCAPISTISAHQAICSARVSYLCIVAFHPSEKDSGEMLRMLMIVAIKVRIE